MKINKKQIIKPLFVLGVFCLSAAYINANSIEVAHADSNTLTITGNEVDDWNIEYGEIGIFFYTSYHGEEAEFDITFTSNELDGTFSMANGKISQYGGYFEIGEVSTFANDCELVIEDNGDNTHTCVCSFDCEFGTFNFETTIEYASEMPEPEKVTCNEYYFEELSNGYAFNFYPIINGVKKDLYISVLKDYDEYGIDGTYSTKDGSVANYQTVIKDFEGYNNADVDVEKMTITYEGKGKHNCICSFYFDEGYFTFETAIQYEEMIIDDFEVECYPEYEELALKFTTTIEEEEKELTITIKGVELEEGTYSLNDNSIDYNGSFFGYTYLGECELTISDAGNGNYSIDGMFSTYHAAYYFETTLKAHPISEYAEELEINDVKVDDKYMPYGAITINFKSTYEGDDVEFNLIIESKAIDGTFSTLKGTIADNGAVFMGPFNYDADYCEVTITDNGDDTHDCECYFEIEEFGDFYFETTINYPSPEPEKINELEVCESYLDVEYYDGNAFFIEIFADYEEEYVCFYLNVESNKVEGTYSTANGAINEYYGSYLEFLSENHYSDACEVTITDNGDGTYNVECSFENDLGKFHFETTIENPNAEPVDAQKLIIDEASYCNDWGNYLDIKTSVNGEYRELFIQLNNETLDGVYSLEDETISYYDSSFIGEDWDPYCFLNTCEVTITDNGDDTHSVVGTFTCEEGSFSFETTVDYPSSTVAPVDGEKIIINNSYVESGFSNYLNFETVINDEFRYIVLMLNTADTIDGKFSLADGSIVSYDTGMFNYTYDEYYNIKSCEITVVDNGDDTHSCSCVIEIDEGVFYFNTAIAYESSTQLGNPITITDYVIDDYAIEDNEIHLLLYGLLEDKEVEVEFKINSNKLEGIYSFADETLDSKDCEVYSCATEMSLPVEDMTLAIIECGDDEYKVNASIMISGYPFYISTTIDNGSGLVNPGIDITAVSYSLESGLFGQSIILIDENGCEYDFMIMASTIQSGVIYNLDPDMYGYYTVYFPNAVTCYQATDASFKHTQNDDGSHRVDAFMKLESGDEFYISYSNDHSNKEAHDSVPATCTSDGTKAYYECVCGKYFEDKECTIEIGDAAALATWLATENEGLISKTGHSMKFDSFVWDGYTAKAKLVCENEGCKETQLVDATVTNAVTTEPTCENKGVKTYTATYESHTNTKTEEIAAKGHTTTEVNGAACTCVTEGYSKAYKCSDCGKYFKDANATQVIGDEAAYNTWKTTGEGKIAAKGHTTVEVKGVAATCETVGYSKAYKCSDCGKYFKDANATQVIGDEAAYNAWKVNAGKIAAKGHTTTEINGVAATCETAGYEKAYKCSDCGKYFKDANATQAIGDEAAYNAWKVDEGKIAAKGHNLTKFEGEKATVEQDGCKDAWKCGNCNKFYSDENGTNLIGDAAAFESWKLGDGKIARLEPTPKEEPKGCNSSIIASSAIVSIITTIGAVLVASKRKEDK